MPDKYDDPGMKWTVDQTRPKRLSPKAKQIVKDFHSRLGNGKHYLGAPLCQAMVAEMVMDLIVSLSESGFRDHPIGQYADLYREVSDALSDYLS